VGEAPQQHVKNPDLAYTKRILQVTHHCTVFV